MVFEKLNEQLLLLSDLIEKLTPEQYQEKISILGEASIGQHSRHIVELLQCLVNGYAAGMVNYVDRSRDLALENDKTLALDSIHSLMKAANLGDKVLLLQPHGNMDNCTVGSTYTREIVYHTEHTLHHLALIKVALRAMDLDLTASSFGMAYSTLLYKSGKCAQ